MLEIFVGWLVIAFSVALGWVLGARIHGAGEYDKGFARGREYQRLVERGVIEP